MQFRAIVPKDCEPGETIRISASDGTGATVMIPSGLVAGDSFVFDLPADRLKNPKALLKEQQKHQQATLSSKRQQRKQKNQKQQKQKQSVIPIAQVDTRPHSGDSIKTVFASLVLIDNASSHSGEGEAGFLGPEIIDCQDFVFALTVGLLVGTSIVFGFLLGILHSTEAIYAVHPIEKPKQPKKQQQQQQRRSKLPNSGPSETA